MLSPEAFNNILKIFFKVRKSVENVFAGEYRSVFKGTGIEFEEVRKYVPGDDIRNIDWKVTARYGEPYIKKFVEERELTLLILLDISRSLDFGTFKSKREVAAEITALLGWSAIINNDRAGMLSFSDEVEKYVKPRKSRHQILKLIREVISQEASGKGTDLANALRYTYKMVNKKAIIFVISDFLSEDFKKPLKILSKKHDVVPLVISDPWEKDFSLGDDIYIEDTEDNSSYLLSAGKRDKIKKELIKLKGKRDRIFKEAGLDYAELVTDGPYFKDLFSYFKRRFSRR